MRKTRSKYLLYPYKATTESITVDCKDLSTDQMYFLEIHRAVSQDTVDDPVYNRDPGALSHSRWLITANRILRLYVTKSTRLQV